MLSTKKSYFISRDEDLESLKNNTINIKYDIITIKYLPEIYIPYINSLFHIRKISFHELDDQDITLNNLPNLEHISICKSDIKLTLDKGLISFKNLFISKYYKNNTNPKNSNEVSIFQSKFRDINLDAKTNITINNIIDNCNYLENLESYEVTLGFLKPLNSYDPAVDGEYNFILDNIYLTKITLINCNIEFILDNYPRLKYLIYKNTNRESLNLNINSNFPILDVIIFIVYFKNINLNFNQSKLDLLKDFTIKAEKCRNFNINHVFVGLEKLEISLPLIKRVEFKFSHDHPELKEFIFSYINTMLSYNFRRVISSKDLERYKNRIEWPIKKNANNIF